MRFSLHSANALNLKSCNRAYRKNELDHQNRRFGMVTGFLAVFVATCFIFYKYTYRVSIKKDFPRLCELLAHDFPGRGITQPM